MASVHRTERRNAFCGSRPFWSLAYGNFRVGQLADVLRLYPKTESVGTGQSYQLTRGNRHFSGNFVWHNAFNSLQNSIFCKSHRMPHAALFCVDSHQSWHKGTSGLFCFGQCRSGFRACRDFEKERKSLLVIFSDKDQNNRSLSA